MKKLISINPVNNQVMGELNCSSKDEITAKVALAHQAKQNWKMIGVHKRIALLTPIIDEIKKREKEIVFLSINEIGKTISEAKSDFISDFEYLSDFLQQGANYIADEVTVKSNNTQHRIIFEPRGVVASIVPWNYPLSNFIWGVIPNLIVGNTIVFKHSEECALFAKLVDDIMQALSLPAGVFTSIYGDGEEGEFLAEQAIDMIWFTGSSHVGRKLFQIAGRKQIKSILEMGGSNPAIIFDDANIEQVIPKIYKGRFSNTGQVCDAIKRLIVHENIFNVVVYKLKQLIADIIVGDPNLEQTQLGPLAAMRQLLLLEAQMQDAIDQGAHIIIGGARPPALSGAYYLPTLITNIKREMRIWQEELFGPVLPIVSFKTEVEAIALANDTVYGLGASIFTRDLNRAERCAKQIEAGSIDINDGSHWHACNPFGGYKMSGMGCEHGRLGFQELCRYKVIAKA